VGLIEAADYSLVTYAGAMVAGARRSSGILRLSDSIGGAPYGDHND
jgi:hypothetical protein